MALILVLLVAVGGIWALSSRDRDSAPGYPPYPGPAEVGETGSAAAAWQEILIGCGAISDIPANRDGVYGPATGDVVRRLESNWGWPDADATADRLTYNRIVEKGCA